MIYFEGSLKFAIRLIPTWVRRVESSYCKFHKGVDATQSNLEAKPLSYDVKLAWNAQLTTENLLAEINSLQVLMLINAC